MRRMKRPKKSVPRSKPTSAPKRALVQAKTAPVEPKIVQLRAPVWAIALADPDPLTLPLPRTATYEQLDVERKSLLGHLDWVTHTLTICNNKKALHEIPRIAERLTRIARLTPKALDRGIEEGRLVLFEDLPF
jgi:hypothetical protein